MSSDAPEYDTVEYWENKYKSTDRPFEWLLPPHVLGDEFQSSLKRYQSNHPLVLHIGPGNSQLSFYLRNSIEDPEQIHNLDFSQTALDWGVETEDARFPDQQKRMKWMRASLTDIRSLLTVCEREQYSIIVDKSTSDSIACGYDVDIDIDFPLSTTPTTIHSNHPKTSYVLPLQVLAINLAYICKPGATWIALSYSQKRFDILYTDLTDDDKEYVDPALHRQGFPDVKKIWTLESSSTIETAEEHTRTNGSIVHRPKAEHYMFILRRTQTPVYLRI